MTPLGPLHQVHVHGITDDMDAELLAGAARQLVAGLGVKRPHTDGMRAATVESLGLLRAITDRLDPLLVHRYLTDAEFAALVADGRLAEARRRVDADIDAVAFEYSEFCHEVEMRRRERELLAAAS